MSAFHTSLNALVDREMPALSDTELRVLLVVLRQTVGWGKSRDWLSRSQLVTRTGRSPDAVSRAVDALVKSGLLIAEDETGVLCATPEARRALQGRLYFRPGETLLRVGVPQRLANLPVISKDPTEDRKRNSVGSYDKTLTGEPLWLQSRLQLSPEEAERIEREKQQIRETLRRRVGDATGRLSASGADLRP